MECTFISDLHGHRPQLKGGDLLIIAGDLTANNTFQSYIAFDYWLKAQDYRKKIFIAGNHDEGMKYNTHLDYLLDEKTEYLCDSETEFEGIKIFGSPWSLWFKEVNPLCKSFMGTEKRLKEKYKLIPEGIDILVTHGPPLSVLDKNERELHCGSKSLRDHLEIVQPKIHVFGHIHEQGGKEFVFKHENGKETLCMNVSYVDKNYFPAHKPRNEIL